MTTAATSLLARQIVDAVRAVVGPDRVALHEPTFEGNEWAYLKECLDSTFVSSVGPFVDRFEHELAAFTGAKHAVAVVNGTAALHVALRLAGAGPNTEVLVPTLTFVATAAAVTYSGAVPHFIEADTRTLGVDSAALREYLTTTTDRRDGRCVNRRTGRVIVALVPMHTFGHPSDIDGLLSVAHDFALALVEDAAESLGSTVGGRHTGTFGLMGTLSFNGNKTLTTGGGGAVLTNDASLARQLKHLTTTAKVPHRWAYTHDEIGYNYRLPNLNAALGCAQLEQLSGFIDRKRELFDRYSRAFASVSGVRLVREPDGCRSNYWLQTLVLDSSTSSERDAILTATNDAGVMTRPAWTLMHQMQPYADCPRMSMPVAESLAERVVNIPSSAHLVKVWTT